MKMHSLLIIFSLLFLLSCRKDSNFSEGKMNILIVDFETYSFEGGTSFNLSSIPTEAIPQITYDYQPAADFGGIQLYHTPDSLLLFDGTIVWTGLGHIIYPASFDNPKSFDLGTDNIGMIDSSNVHANFNIPFGELHYEGIWNSISQLEIIQDEYDSDFHIEVFCYTPSVGSGNPADWDYFVLFYS